MTKNNLLVSTGKTGGHILPALIFIQKFIQTDIENKVIIVCFSKKLFEENIQSDRVEYVVFEDWKSSNIKAVISNTFKIKNIIKKNYINKVLIFGSYLSIPVIFASFLSKVNLFLHEQNILPGRANRFAQFFVKKIFISYPITGNYFYKISKKKIIITGSLIRKFNNKNTVKKENQILIMGGSQGAKSINNFILNNLTKIESSKLHFKVITGEKNYLEFINSIPKKPINLEIINFTNDILNIMSSSKLIISRAGANTLSEIAYVGKPSVLIPFPYSAERHQELNANYFKENNASIVLSDSDLIKNESFDLILNLTSKDEQLMKMGENAHNLYLPDAEEKILINIC